MHETEQLHVSFQSNKTSRPWRAPQRLCYCGGLEIGLNNERAVFQLCPINLPIHMRSKMATGGGRMEISCCTVVAPSLEPTWERFLTDVKICIKTISQTCWANRTLRRKGRIHITAEWRKSTTKSMQKGCLQLYVPKEWNKWRAFEWKTLRGNDDKASQKELLTWRLSWKPCDLTKIDCLCLFFQSWCLHPCPQFVMTWFSSKPSVIFLSTECCERQKDVINKVS